MTPTTQSMQDFHDELERQSQRLELKRDAAPQLYAALQALVDDALKLDVYLYPDKSPKHYAVIVQAELALAKADGEAEEPVTYPEPIRVPGNEVTIDIARQEEMND